MEFQAFLIKYAEIGLKGKNRGLFEDALMRQIRHAPRPVEGQFKVNKVSGRIYVLAETAFDYEETLEALTRVFGVSAVCPLLQIEDHGPEDLFAKVIEYMDKVYEDKKITFNPHCVLTGSYR